MNKCRGKWITVELRNTSLRQEMRQSMERRSPSPFFFFERGLKMVARASMKFLLLKEESDKDKIMVAQ